MGRYPMYSEMRGPETVETIWCNQKVKRLTNRRFIFMFSFIAFRRNINYLSS